MTKKTAYRVNCGSDSNFSDPEGNVWQADFSFEKETENPGFGPNGFCRISGECAVREPDLPFYPEDWGDLIRTECYGLQSYRFDLSPGSWRIRLIVAETHEVLSSMQRGFSLTLNGQTLGGSITPAMVAQGFARVGEVLIEGFEVQSDGLEIRFSENANIYGIEIIPFNGSEYSVSSIALAPQRLVPLNLQAKHQPRFLFIGHSGTFYWAIPQTVQRLINQEHPEILMDITTWYRGGRDIEFFYKAHEPETLMLENEYDYIVIQDSSCGPIESPAVLEVFMPRMIEKVRASGATPLIYAYGARRQYHMDQRRDLMRRYETIGRTHNVAVIPCAAALVAAMEDHPDVDFIHSDGTHLRLRAGYLMACTWYRALTGQSAAKIQNPITLGGYVIPPENIALEMAAVADEIFESGGECWGLEVPVLKEYF